MHLAVFIGVDNKLTALYAVSYNVFPCFSYGQGLSVEGHRRRSGGLGLLIGVGEHSLVNNGGCGSRGVSAR